MRRGIYTNSTASEERTYRVAQCEIFTRAQLTRRGLEWNRSDCNEDENQAHLPPGEYRRAPGEDAEIRRNTTQSDLAAAKTRVVQATQQLQRTEARAPFDGIVSDRKVSAGDTAQIGKELVKVIDPSSKAERVTSVRS